MPRATIGVGFLGAGPVTQAIHLPTLARLRRPLRSSISTTSILTVPPRSRRGSVRAHSTTIDRLLDDPRVDVVAICSPHRFHAAQVIAACRAGKKAVLCEKPFAMSGEEASEIAAVSAETGVPILVGAMHTFDPAWKAAVANWGDLPATSHTIRSSIVLPPNPRFEDFATEVITRPSSASPDLDDVEVSGSDGARRRDGSRDPRPAAGPRAAPVIRRPQVLRAHVLAPLGYQIVLTAGGKRIELHAAMTATWRPDWALEAYQRRTGAARRVHAVLRPRRLRCHHDPHRRPGIGVRTGKSQRL